MREKGFGRVPDNAQFPAKITTFSELVEYVTIIMWNSSVYHAAVNFGQFVYLGYVPNSPCAMVKPPPTQVNSPNPI